MQAVSSIYRLLVVDDDDLTRTLLTQRVERIGYKLSIARSAEEALPLLDLERFDAAILDIMLPGMDGLTFLAELKLHQPHVEAIMLTGHGSVQSAIQAMRLGAYDYIAKPFEMADLEVHIARAIEKGVLARRESQREQALRYESPRYELVGNSPAMRRVRALIEKVAATDTTALVRGPSGTGKELVARAIHLNSPRAAAPLISVNCATLQESLLESELFGHEKGAFTGATNTKAGLFEVAEGGTLFIDEVAEMSPGLQAKLLRVLEDGRFRRVGSTQEISARVRVVAATNKPLEAEMRAGRFRDDLFYRLNVVTLALPPLRERREDVPSLVEHFLVTRQVGPHRARVEQDAMGALIRHEWPGNIRELANVIERAQILAEDSTITLDDLPEGLGGPSDPTPNAVAADPNHLREVERQHVWAMIQRTGNNKVQTAKLLGISRRALYRLIAKYGLDA